MPLLLDVVMKKNIQEQSQFLPMNMVWIDLVISWRRKIE